MASRFAASQFGEAFLTTLTQTRKLKQDRELFAQEQATTNRRINLLDIYRRGLLENQRVQEDRRNRQLEFNQQLGLLDLAGQGFTQEQEGAPGSFPLGEKFLLPPEPEEKQPDFKKAGTGRFDDKEFTTFFDPVTEETRRVGIGDVVPDVIQSPHISSLNLDRSFENYAIYRDVYNQGLREGTDEVTFLDPRNEEITLSLKNIKTARDRARKDFIIEADNRADALEKTYKGFEAFYNDFKSRKDLKLDKISVGRLMDIISEDMAGFPADAIREMHELLVKTNG